MPSFSRMRSVFTGLGACGGALIFYYAFRENERRRAHASWTTNYNPSVKWDYNWDKREPRSLVKPNNKDDNKYNEQLEKLQPTAVRNLFLIRHGQYNLNGSTDKEKRLTELGREQAELTGQRLKDLKIPFTRLVRSTMSRATETAEIIQKHLPNVPTEESDFIQEGAPVPPEPPVGHWRPEKHQFYEDGARIEAAFRKYFHRAPVTQEKSIAVSTRGMAAPVSQQRQHHVVEHQTKRSSGPTCFGRLWTPSSSVDHNQLMPSARGAASSGPVCQPSPLASRPPIQGCFKAIGRLCAICVTGENKKVLVVSADTIPLAAEVPLSLSHPSGASSPAHGGSRDGWLLVHLEI